VVDIGCGDGLLDSLVLSQRPDLSIEGYDVLVRPNAHIAVHPYDGRQLPCADRLFDAVVLIDVLHHTHDPRIVLGEAARVTRRSIVIKDHFADGFLASATLRFMDHIGNAHHGIALPYNFLTSKQWDMLFVELGLHKSAEITSLGLYPWFAAWVFERSLHFIARLDLAAVKESNFQNHS
jgi:SAM-dependent methyltransferase